MADFAPGRYIVSFTDATGARDPIALNVELKSMRNRLEEETGHKPALILTVVADGEEEHAVQLIKQALER